MKNILYGFLATLLFCNLTFAQLMSDAAHKTMMDTYATNLNNELTTNLPQGLSLDQYKRGILKGDYTLSPTAKSNITAYATQLKTYGAAFATAKGLVANTDALKYFYSTFMPSTVVLGGTIVESTTAPGLTGLEMWNCALKSFNAENCGSTLLIGDENNLNELADISVNILKLPTESPTNPENMGILVMLNGFGECMEKYFELEQVAFNLSNSNDFIHLNEQMNQFENLPGNIEEAKLLANRGVVNLTTSERVGLATSLGFSSLESFTSYVDLKYSTINRIIDNPSWGLQTRPDNDFLIVMESAYAYYNRSRRSCNQIFASHIKRIRGNQTLYGLGCAGTGLTIGGLLMEASPFVAVSAGAAVFELCMEAVNDIISADIEDEKDKLWNCKRGNGYQ